MDSKIPEAAVSKSLRIDETINSMIESDTKIKCFEIDNAIATLKEMSENGQCTMPKYKFTGPEYIGYDGNGNPKWACSCMITNDKIGLANLFLLLQKGKQKSCCLFNIILAFRF